MGKWLKILVFVGLFMLLPSQISWAADACGVLASGGGDADVQLGPFDVPAGGALQITAETRSGQGTAILVAIGGIPNSASVQFTAIHTVSIPGPAKNVEVIIDWQTNGLSENAYSLSLGGPCAGERVRPDDRLNWEMGDLSAVMYAREDVDGNPTIEIYRVEADGRGAFILAITQEDIAPFIDNPPAVNTEIKAGGNVVVYALTTGEFQVNIGPDGEGKVWSVIFDGLPPEAQVYGYEWDSDGD